MLIFEINLDNSRYDSIDREIHKIYTLLYNFYWLYKLIYVPKKFNKVANDPWTDFDYDKMTFKIKEAYIWNKSG